MVNLVSMRIILVFYKFSNMTIKLAKISCFKFYKIDLNIISKIIVFIIYNCILIKPVYNIFIEQIIVSCLNLKPLGKKSF